MAKCQRRTAEFETARDTYHDKVKALEKDLALLKETDRLREIECGAKGFEARVAAAAEARSLAPTYAIATGRHCAPLAHGPERRMSVLQCEDWCDADASCTGFVREDGSCRLLAVPTDECSGVTVPTGSTTYRRFPPGGPLFSHACLGPAGTRLTHATTACDRAQSEEACAVFGDQCAFDGVACRPKGCTSFRRLAAPIDVVACRRFLDPDCSVIGASDQEAEAAFIDKQVQAVREEALAQFSEVTHSHTNCMARVPAFQRAAGAAECARRCGEGCTGFVMASGNRCGLLREPVPAGCERAQAGVRLFKRN